LANDLAVEEVALACRPSYVGGEGRRMAVRDQPQAKVRPCWVLVVCALNPSYSGGRDQEDCSLKPAQAKFARPYLENTHHKKGPV
jgi:hypothetical protein